MRMFLRKFSFNLQSTIVSCLKETGLQGQQRCENIVTDSQAYAILEYILIPSVIACHAIITDTFVPVFNNNILTRICEELDLSSLFHYKIWIKINFKHDNSWWISRYQEDSNVRACITITWKVNKQFTGMYRSWVTFFLVTKNSDIKCWNTVSKFPSQKFG